MNSVCLFVCLFVCLVVWFVCLLYRLVGGWLLLLLLLLPSLIVQVDKGGISSSFYHVRQGWHLHSSY